MDESEYEGKVGLNKKKEKDSDLNCDDNEVSGFVLTLKECR